MDDRGKVGFGCSAVMEDLYRSVKGSEHAVCGALSRQALRRAPGAVEDAGGVGVMGAVGAVWK